MRPRFGIRPVRCRRAGPVQGPERDGEPRSELSGRSVGAGSVLATGSELATGSGLASGWGLASGSGLVSGSVFGKIAGTSAGKQVGRNA